MEIAVANFEVKNTTITKEIEFPLYRWWNARKESIIKMYPVYYDHDPKLMSHIVIIRIDLGWNCAAQIRKEHVLVHGNVIENEIQHYFNDYTEKATEAEFLEMRWNAFESLL
jgi:hypothetical protein